MAGLNLIFSFDDTVSNRSSDYELAVAETLFEQSHNAETVYENDQILSSFSGYDGYPARTFENDGIKYYVEGKFFNHDRQAADKNITSFSKRLFQDDKTAKKDLTDWLLTVDGEFLVVAYDPMQKRIHIFNDIFGSLPCYMYKTDWGVVFSRSFLFVSKFVTQKQFDQMAMAQFLTLRYTIGDRTYLKDVYSIKPAQLISIDTDTRTLNREVLHVLNFEKKKYRNRSTKKNASEAAKLFVQGCRRRTDPQGKNIISLSGGLDSRAIAAGLSNAGVDFQAVTQLDFNKTAINDFKCARQTAEVLDIECQALQAGQMMGSNMLRMLKMKGGFVYLGKTFLFQMYDKIVSDYGHRVVLFTGLGGDKVARDTRKKGIWAVDQLIDRLVGNECVMTLEMALELTGVSKKCFYNELREEIAAYPEKPLSQKSVHLNFYMRNIKWHFEGIDRLRNFFWPGSPFFSIDFFHYIMNCPDGQKTNLRFYTLFLENLNEEVLKLPYAVNLSLTPIPLSRCRNLTWYWYCRISRSIDKIRRWPNPLRFVIKRIKKIVSGPPQIIEIKYEHSENLVKLMKEQMSICSKEGDFMNWPAVKDVLENSEKYNNESLYILLTVIAITEQLATGRCSLEKYKDADFGSYNSLSSVVKPTSIS